jgi:hypothetical protein
MHSTNPTPGIFPNPFQHITGVEYAKFVGYSWSFLLAFHFPYFFPAFNKVNPARAPKGFLIGSDWVRPTSLPEYAYWPQGGMLWIRLDRGITPPMP